MKKIIALVLCLVLLGSCTAFAETAEKEELGKVNVNGNFDIQCKLPETYQMAILTADTTRIIALIKSEDDTKPFITLSIAFNEEYTRDGVGLRLNDLSEEQMESLKETFVESAENVEFKEGETASGTKVLIAKGDIGDASYVSCYSIYLSYEVEAIVSAGMEAEDKTLGDEWIQMVTDFFSSIDFVETK